MKRLVLAVLAVLALAGCSSGSHQATPAGPPTAQSIASKAGCTGWRADTAPLALYVSQSGTCLLNGAEITVDVFKDNAMRDRWLATAAAFGGAFGHGDRWAISGADANAVHAGALAAGGK